MVQKRVKTGREFEEYICKLYGFSRHIKNPRLKWSGAGRSNIKKLISLDKDPEKFKPILSESRFIKCDAQDKEGNLYEIKKYNKEQLKTYKLYSEPIIKVAPTRSKWGKGNPYFDNFSCCNEYNSFIEELTHTKWWKDWNQIILDSIKYSNRGIYCKDGFLHHNQLDFLWVINKGGFAPIFDGYHRLSIVFKIKEEEYKNIDFTPPQKTIIEELKDSIKKNNIL